MVAPFLPAARTADTDSPGPLGGAEPFLSEEGLLVLII